MAASEPLLSIDAVADYLGVSVPTIYDWRVAGEGPRAIKVGRHLTFAVSDVQAWVAAQCEPAPGQGVPGSVRARGDRPAPTSLTRCITRETLRIWRR